MPKFVDDLHVAGAVTAAAAAGSVTHKIFKASGQTVDLEQYLDTDGVTVQAKVDANFVGSFAGLVATAPSGSAVPMVVKGAPSQTGDLQQWQSSSGTVVGKVTSGGGIYSAGGAALTSDGRLYTADGAIDSGSVIYLRPTTQNFYSMVLNSSGIQFNNMPIIPTGTTAVGLVVKGLASQTADLQQWQDSSGNVLARIDSTGSYYSGGSVGSPVTTLSNGGFLLLGVASGTSTAAIAVQTRYSGSGLVVNRQDTQSGHFQAAAWGGGSTDSGYVDIVGGTTTQNYALKTTTGFASQVGMAVRATSSQTGDLQQWQDSSGTPQLWVTSSGQLNGAGGYVTIYNYLRASNLVASGQIISTGPGFYGNSSGPSLHPSGLIATAQTATSVGLVVKGFTAQSSDLQQWQNSSGTVLAKIDSGGNLNLSGSTTATLPNSVVGGTFSASGVQDPNGTGALLIPLSAGAGSLVSGGLQINTRSWTNGGLAINGVASQFANLTAWGNQGTVLAAVTPAGLFKWSSGNVQTTVGAAGGASALPASPTKYLKVVGDDGVTYVIPAYAAS